LRVMTDKPYVRSLSLGDRLRYEVPQPSYPYVAGSIAGPTFRTSQAQYLRIYRAYTNVAVDNGPNGKYVRTHADGQWNDNLLALPECRV
jgi:hypothetical protein